jgi:ornithine carbamoyltransferase
MSFNEDKPLVFQVRNIQDTSNNNAMVGRGSQKVTGAVIQGTIKSGMLVAVHKPRDAAANIIQVTAAEVKQVHKSNESEYLISASCVDGALDVTIQYQKTIEPDCVWECGEYNLLYDANNNDYDGRCELLSPV